MVCHRCSSVSFRKRSEIPRRFYDGNGLAFVCAGQRNGRRAVPEGADAAPFAIRMKRVAFAAG